MSEVNQVNVFQIFGVYFANCYWNSLYNEALNIWHRENIESLDEAYKLSIKRYNLAFCRKANSSEPQNRHFIEIMKDLHKNYKMYLGVSDTYLDFIDTVVKFLIPPDYYAELPRRDQRKDDIFREILSKTLTRFTIFASQDGLQDVVDREIRKDAEEQVCSWKKKFIEFLQLEKNNFCSLLLANSSGIDIRDADEIPSIPKSMLDKINERMRILMNEKATIIRERNQFAKLAQSYKSIILKQKETISQLSTRGAPQAAPIAGLNSLNTQASKVVEVTVAPPVEESENSGEENVADLTEND